MFGKIGKGLTKLNPFSDKDKDKSEKKDKNDKTDKKGREKKTNALSHYADNELAKSTRVTARQTQQTSKTAQEWAGFQESSQQRSRHSSLTDKSILMMAEQKPKRQINVNQTIFEVMAAERDKLPDIEEKKSDNSSSDESSAILVHTTEDAHDLTNLFMKHRGNENSDDSEGELKLKKTFIESNPKQRNRMAGALVDDLAIFEVVNSPPPKQIEEVKDLRTKKDDDRRQSVQVNYQGNALITNTDSIDLDRKYSLRGQDLSKVVAQLQQEQQNDDFFDGIEESTKIMSKLTDIRQTYTKRQRTVILSEKEFSEGTSDDLLAASPSLVRADTDRLKLLELAHNDSNMFLDKQKREALVKKKSDLEADDTSVEMKSYDSEDSLDDVKMDQATPQAQPDKASAEPALSKQASKNMVNNFINDLVQGNIKNQETDSLITVKYDIFKLINKNEHLFIKYAEKKLVENKTYVMERAQKLKKATSKENITTQRVLGGPLLLQSISSEITQLRAKHDSRATCCAVTDELILLGTSAGVLWAFEKESQKLWGKFFEDDKLFRGNAITCLDVHPLRTEYVIIGYAKGQLILVDLTDLKKSKKVVKDHHKNASIVSVKFCDYIKEREHTLAQQLMIAEMEKQGAPIDQIQKTIMTQEVTDKQCWMVISTDTLGRLVVTTIQNVAFGLCSADKTTIIDPNKDDDTFDKIEPQFDESPLFYPVIDSRFYNKVYPQGFQNDSRTLVAVGSTRDVIIYEILKEKWSRRFRLERPKCYYSENIQGIVSFANEPPCIAWGYGRTPCFKDRTYALLAISWGCLIQLVILNEISNDKGHDFFLDGHYILAPGTVYNSPESGQMKDIQIQGMRFLSESLLFCYTSTQDVRVLYTQKFCEQQFQNAKLDPDKQLITLKALQTLDQSVLVQNDGIDFDKIDSRVKMSRNGSTLTKEQCEIELERRNSLEYPLLSSVHGPRAHQTMHSYQDRIVLLTDQGIYNMYHLTWQAYLSHLEQSMQASWIDIFEKAIEFFNGRVKGFKGVVDDHMTRKDMIKGDLKELIHGHIDRVIRRWKEDALRKKKNGLAPEQVRDDLKDKLCTLIRMSIELCVEIWDPFFLFNELFQKFVEQEMSIQFAEEIKPYILSGVFSEMPIPEAILNFHILQHHHNIFLENLTEQNTSPTSGKTITPQNPAENFEKIIVNLCFLGCQKNYKEDLIKFCREHQLSSGLIYLCIQTYDDQGPIVALSQLQDFFKKTCEMERLRKSTDSSPYGQKFTLKEVQELENMPANMPKREFIEKSSAYLGYKLLWAARLFLLGKKFPKGTFELVVWNAVVHDVVELITQAEFIRTMTEIDAEAYFQTISIVFNNPSKQYSFLKEGRVKVENSGGLVKTDKESMNHSLILERLQQYAGKLDRNSEVRMQFLFFVASIAKDVDLQEDREFFFNITLDLIHHSKQFLTYNKLQLNRQMTGKQLYRKLSRGGNDAPDSLKHYQVTEEHIEQLLRKCEPLEKQQIDILVEAMHLTSFDSLKLILFAKQENYIKCIELLVERSQSSSFLSMKMQDGFAFIIEKYFMLQNRIKTPKEDTPQRYQFEMFEKEIYNRTHQLVRMDAHKSVGLADALFCGDHNTFIQKLNDFPKEQYDYISKLIELQYDEIKQTVQNYTLNRQEPTKSKQWLKILRIHLKLACQLAPDQVIQIVEKTIKENFYPLEDCLKICQEFRQLEACALLQKKIGAYRESIMIYLQLLDKDLNMKAFRKELYTYDRQLTKKKQDARAEVEAKRKKVIEEREALEKQRRLSLRQNMDVGVFTRSQAVELPDIEALIPLPTEEKTWNVTFRQSIEFKIFCQTQAPNILLFERTISRIEKICVAHPDELFKSNESTWQSILASLFKLAQNPVIHRKRYCRSYLIRKMVNFVKKTLPYVNFKSMIEAVLKMQDKIKWRSVRELVSELYTDLQAETGMCESAEALVQDECKEMESDMFHIKGTGLTFRYLKCELCKRDVDKTSKESQFTAFVSGYKKDDDSLVLFECKRSPYYNHVYHNGCLRSFIQDELRRDKKAGLKEVDVLKAFRCPECYQQKQSIDEQAQKMTMMRTSNKSAKDRSTIVGGKRTTEQKSSGTSSQGDASDVSPAPRGKSARGDPEDNSNENSSQVRKSINDWRKERLLDRIKKFDQEDEFDSLTIDSFKKM